MDRWVSKGMPTVPARARWGACARVSVWQRERCGHGWRVVVGVDGACERVRVPARACIASLLTAHHVTAEAVVRVRHVPRMYEDGRVDTRAVLQEGDESDERVRE